MKGETVLIVAGLVHAAGIVCGYRVCRRNAKT